MESSGWRAVGCAFGRTQEIETHGEINKSCPGRELKMQQ